VAAVEATCNLIKFCEWWKKQSNSPDIESLAMSGLPKGMAGQKCSVPKHSRRMGGGDQGAAQLQHP